MVIQPPTRQPWSILFFAPLLMLLAASQTLNDDLLGASTRHHANIRDAVYPTHHSWNRYLQTCNIVTDEGCSTNVQAVCDYFNADNSSSVGDCQCSRFGQLDTKVTCSFQQDCRNATASCFVGTVERIFNPQLESQTVETCVRFPASETPSALTCIRTFPKVDGNFRELEQCAVQYTSTGVDKRLCSSCNICPASVIGGGSSGEEAMAEISFNCCNLQVDLQQSCYPVTTDGVGIPNFDPIIEAGTCVSAAAMMKHMAAIMVMIIATTMLWI